MDRYIVGLYPDINEYIINGVRYIVERHYEPMDFCHMRQNTRIDHRLENYLKSDFVDLTLPPVSNKIEVESVRSAAGKEDYNAAEKEN